MNKAVFLDRDGTINEDMGDFCSQEKLVFIPGSIEALKMLQKDFSLFIITNQSGVGKHVFSEEEFLQFNEYFDTFLKNQSITIKYIYYCPHTKEDNCIVIASLASLPVIGVPMQTQVSGGLDSLLSIVQMPSGVPVATVAVGKAGAKNAGILAAQILGVKFPEIREKIKEYKKEIAESVKAKNEKLKEGVNA